MKAHVIRKYLLASADNSILKFYNLCQVNPLLRLHMTMEKMDRHQTNIAAATDEVKQTITKSELERAMTNSDAKRLAELGYENQLERGFSLPALIGLCLCLMGTWEATSSVLAQALLSGGAPCLWYNL